MFSKNVQRPAALFAAALLYSTYLTDAALAQVREPAASAPPAVLVQASADMPAYADNDRVLLADFVKRCEIPSTPKGHRSEEWRKNWIADHCDTPRAARPSTISEDTPVVDHATFLRDFPQMGEQGYQVLRHANQSLCDEVGDELSGIKSLDNLFNLANNEYQMLEDIHNQLPEEMRHATRIMQTSQAVQAGLLCLLTAGLYCLAAVVVAAGNIVTANANLRLQLANIRLAIANIVVTRLNIWSNRLTLRLDARWIKWTAPACVRLGYNSAWDLGPMPAMPTVPVGFGGSNPNAAPPPSTEQPPAPPPPAARKDDSGWW